MSENDADGSGTGSGCNPSGCFKPPFVFFSFLTLLLFSASFLLAATHPGSLFSFVLFFQLKSPVEPALLKVLYHLVYLLIHNFKFLRKFLHNF